MEEEKISVIVPAYNIAPWLPRCLDSILAQTYENLEVIVVNDGSTDDTWAVLEDYAAAHPRVTAIHQENGGVTAARLRGVAESDGDWIGFIDGDDVIEPQMYARLMENAHEFQAEISQCGHQVLFPHGQITYVHNTGIRCEQNHMEGLKTLLDGAMIESGLCTKLYKRSLFAGLSEWMDFSIRNNEDLLMNYFLFEKAQRTVYEDVCPYHYILREGSASFRQFHEHSLFDPIRVRQKILEDCEPRMQKYARIALMRNCLFAYGQLALNPDPQYDDYRERVRNLLVEQKAWFSTLSRRNELLANMVRFTPWLFRFAYRAYVKLFQREEQH